MEPDIQRTVLVAEIGDAAKLLATAGDVAGMGAIASCMDLVRKAAESSGGKLLRVVGDEVMVLFDSPDAAAGAAFRMHAAVAQLPTVAGSKLGIAVGLHSGPVQQGGEDPLGDTVKLAARLVLQARKGQTVASGRTAALLKTSSANLIRPPGPKEGQTGLYEIASDPRVGFQATRAIAFLRLQFRGKLVSCWSENASIVMGRSRGCALVVSEPLASRRHCTVRLRDEGGFVVQDHSTNGTGVRNSGESAVLLQGSELALATHGWIAFGHLPGAGDAVVEFFGH